MVSKIFEKVAWFLIYFFRFVYVYKIFNFLASDADVEVMNNSENDNKIEKTRRTDFF